jgi:hypothetical protein
MYSQMLWIVSPRDKDEFGVWQKFVEKVVVDLAVVVRVETVEEGIGKSKDRFRQDLAIGKK